MKRSKGEVYGKARDALDVRFEAQHLTSFSGLIIFQRLFAKLGLKGRLWRCFRHLRGSEIYAHHVVVMMLIVHLLLGFRELRDARYYHDDEMVKRLLGLKHLPEVSTVSRALASADERSVHNLRAENRHLVLERLGELGLARVTVDFDGSVQNTGRHAEGTAVGFNKKKKGSRSYYPLFGTIAQTGQALDVHHRPGNVHDSNGAKDFVLQCVDEIREKLPKARIETRVDSAFFSQTIVDALHGARVQFTASVPFERFAALKSMLQGRRRWRRIDEGAELLREPVEAQPLERALPLRVHPKARAASEQDADSARPLRASRGRLRLQGHRDQQARASKASGEVPRRTWFSGRDLRGAEVALSDGLRSGDYAGRQSALLGLGDARAQPHSGAADDRPPTATRNHRQAYGALGLRETPNDQA